MIFQDPMTSMNPVYQVGDQIAEQILAHREISKAEAKERAIELLKAVGIPGAEERVDDYPHEFSGGMRQRAMIAMGLSLEPPLLIADEPTTALDVTIQAQILRLLKQLNYERGLAVILITHDLGVVADIADRVLVMYAGRVVETGTLDQIFYDPQHPYTWGLLGSIDAARPSRGRRGSRRSRASRRRWSRPPEGCHFRPRCPHAFSRCTEVPELAQRGGSAGHLDRCWLAGRAEADRCGCSSRATSAWTRPREQPPNDRRRPLLEVTDLVKHFPIKSGVWSTARSARCRPSTGSRSRSQRARRSDW